MRALLLAAGLGTRLRPLTNYLPKCLTPIHGRPLLDYWLETLLDHGVEKVLINTHYMAPMVLQYLNHSTWLPHIKTVNEEILLGTGGSILKNRDFFNDETFLVAHSDNLTIFDMKAFANQHSLRPTGSELTMMLFESPDPHLCGIVELDQRCIVKAFYEKVYSPTSNLANAAVYMVEPSVIDLIAALGKEVVDFSTEVIPQLMGRIFTYRNSYYHRDVGTISSWNEAHKDFPIIQSNAQNARAWRSILESGEGNLPSAIEQASNSGIG